MATGTSATFRPVEPRHAALIQSLIYHARHREASTYGLGLDEYARDEPLEHPMAYSLYCRGMLALAKVTGDARWRRSAAIAGSRLLELSSMDGGRAWGLPFSFRDLPPHHPYAITTALGCLSLTALARDPDGEAWLGASEEAAAWLAHDLPWTSTAEGSAPWYAPEDPRLTYNVTSMVAAALAEAFEIHQQSPLLDRAWLAARYVLDGQHRTGCWRYGSEGEAEGPHSLADSVVDLVHTSYILDGLVTALAASQRGGFPLPVGIADAISRGIDFIGRYLLSRRGFAHEKVVLVDAPEDEAAQLLFRDGLARSPVRGGAWLVTFPAESRAWGYGAGMGALSRAVQIGFRNADRPLDFLASRVLGSFMYDSGGRIPYRPGEPLYFPRHESHVFEGMAGCALTLMRPRRNPG